MKLIAKALLQAQKEMGNAVKDSKNPFFKSTYADLNSIREACMPALNNNGIVVLQPTTFIEGKNFIKTVLLHESGETIEALTEIVYSKQNDAKDALRAVYLSMPKAIQTQLVEYVKTLSESKA